MPVVVFIVGAALIIFNRQAAMATWRLGTWFSRRDYDERIRRYLRWNAVIIGVGLVLAAIVSPDR